MKKYTSLFIGLVLLSACENQEDDSLAGKRSQLQDLKSQVAEMNIEISVLSAEIGELQPKTEAKVTYVSVMPVVSEEFVHYVVADARLDAVNNVFVSARLSGALTNVFVTEGDYVKKGQTIATIDNSILTNSITEVEIQLEMARTLYVRQKALWDQKIGTEIQFIQAKTQVESLEKKLITMNVQNDMSTVTSPISGYVDEVRLKSGEMASPGIGIVRVVNFDNLKVVANIPDTYAGTIEKGNVVTIRFPDLNKEITSKLSFVSQTVNPVTRTFTAEAKVPLDRQLKPNLNAVVEINDLSHSETIVIQRNLIQRTEDGEIVYIGSKEGDIYIARGKKVTTGLSYNGEVEILEGLNIGDMLITEGYQEITDGERVSF